jgi:uncharacterized protein (DUF1800 family)
MSSFTPPCIRRGPFGALLLITSLFWAVHQQVRGVPDMNVTKAVWKSLYGVTDAQINDSAWLARDDDGDGISNGAEIVAGTNPFRAGSTLKVASLTADQTTVSLSFPTQSGKLYILQASTTLSSANWTALNPNAQVIGDGNTQTLAGAKSGSSTFYRVLVQDVDSASDQVGDWAKKLLGYTTAAPIGSQSSFDHTQLATSLLSQNVISLSATDSSATQPTDATTAAGDLGVITVQRSGYNLLVPITVPLSKSGSAVEGTDYAAMPSTVTFAAGVNSVDLKITPLYNASRQTSCVVTLTAGAPGSGSAVGNYSLSPLSISAGVTISPSGSPIGIGLIGTYWTGSSSTYASPINFGPTTVSYTYTNTTTTTGNAVVTYTGTGFVTGGRVNLSFTAGSLLGGSYDGVKIISATSGSTFTVPITGTAVPASQSGSAACLLNPPLVTRLDPTVAFSWLYGTPNATNAISSDNYSASWDGYLAPSTAGTYVFQVDADDGARVFLDTGSGLTQILDNGFTPPATGTFKQSGTFTLAVPAAAANRYHIRVEFVETTGNAKCKFQWQINGGTFANIPNSNIYTTNTTNVTGWNASYYANTTLNGTPVRTQIDSAITSLNNGDWGAGSPDPLIFQDNFACRWTGQVMPQYTENYTFIVNADDAAKLWLNGQPMTLRRLTNDNPTVAYTYTQNSSTVGTVVITYSSAALAVGDVVPLAFTTGNLNASYNTSTLYTVTAVTASNFTVALSGTGLPASGTGNGTINTINLPIDWPVSSTIDRYATIALQAGVLYDIKMESFELTSNAGATLSWFSPSQSRQVIPSTRLFPTMTGQTPRPGDPAAAPPSITSATNVVTLLNSGSPFSLVLSASNGAGAFTATGLPSWLTLTNGVLSGTPTQAGIYQFTVSTTNSAGTTSAIITVQVNDTGSSLTRELWTSGVAGPALADVPWTSAPTTADTVTSAEDSTTTYANNTGERLRGYFTPTTTGNYYFWLSASNAAELWISNNGEPVNKVRRAYVTGPTGTASRTWNTAASQKSGWLSLTAGQPYYIEVLHNTGASPASSNFSVGWFLDPTGNSAAIPNGSAPAAAATGGVLPGFVLSPWDNPPTTATPGALYLTNLQGAAGLTNITGSGGAFMRVSGSSAVVHLNYSGLTSGSVFRRIYTTQVSGSPIMLFDFDAQDRNYPAQRTSDKGYSWSMQASDLTALANGTVFVSIGTVNNPSGELAGTFGAVPGSQTAPAVPVYTIPADDSSTVAGASRFLTQASFGPGTSDIGYVQTNGYRAWIENQFSLSPTHNVPYILTNLSSDPQNPYNSTLFFNSWWKNAVTAPDQLRQRVAFALSEILVVSDTGPLNNNGRVLGDFYDNLLDTCLDSYRDILKQATLSPAMGIYLDMLQNDIGSDSTGIHPNENYAREIMQLFSIGLYRLWPDGSLVLDSNGNAVPTYDQSVITGMARVFTGWSWGQSLSGSRLPTNFYPSSNYLDPMVLVPTHHEPGKKVLLDNVVIPPATVTLSTDASHDPNPSPVSIQSTDPALGAGNLVTTSITNSYDLSGLRDLETALDNIVSNSAVGPYICRQLIQRLVTSNPKPAYVQRVVRAFNGERNFDGVATGVRGDMKEVVRSILLDYEARSTTAAADVGFGKQREPLLRLTGPARTFSTSAFTGSSYRQIGGQALLITTPSAHNLSIGDTVQMESFVDSGSSTSTLPTTGGYSVANTTPSYSAVGTTGVVTVNSPGFQTGDSVNMQFTSGTLGTTTPYSNVQTYTVTSVTATSFTVSIGANSVSGTPSGNALLTNNFTINNTGLATANYTSTTTTATISASGYTTGHQLYVKFSTGGLSGGTFDKAYTISSTTTSTFTIALTGSPAATSGSVYIPRFSGGYNITNSGSVSTISLQTTGNNDLNVGDQVWIDFLVTNTPTGAASQVYTVASVPFPNLFTVTTTPTVTAGSQSTSGQVTYPLTIASWTRSGTCIVKLGTWNMSYSQSDLSQTPLDSTTVFNFFYPDFHYPGEMAKAGMTTPEFQLSNDSNTMNLTNVVTGGFLSGGNIYGFQSFRSGSGAVPMDISPYMTAALTSNAAIPALVDTLATRLIGGSLNATARTAITNYVANTTNFPYTTPTTTQMRDRVRAIIHLIVTSAEYAIQK